jgi:hypothetical protein
MIAPAVLLVLVLTLVALDIRKSGGWDPWADFDATTRGDGGLSALGQ